MKSLLLIFFCTAEEFEVYPIPQFKRKHTFCSMVRLASIGHGRKALSSNFRCRGASEVFRFVEPGADSISGERLFGFGRNSMRNMQTLATISVMILLVIIAAAWLLFKRITRPASALGQWARTLNTANLHTPPPDFVYPELNELAVLIRTSLSAVQDSLEREHRFLRHSSHELRTPISIIRNNIELLYKAKEPGPIFLNPREQHIFERIDRASLTMVHLTGTLLWLSRDSAETLPLTNLDLAQLLQGLVAESRYLLKDKEVELVVETMPSMVTIAEVPARIVLANLIRNAFQHTSRGVVRISQTGACVEIVNDVGTTGETEDLGFGLGLQLTRQLTSKLGWTYINNTESGKYRAEVRMH